jgi:hypothetical protein
MNVYVLQIVLCNNEVFIVISLWRLILYIKCMPSVREEVRPFIETVLGRDIAQAVTRRLLIAAAEVRAQVRSCGICGEQSGAGVGFLRVPRFPLPILIPLTSQRSSSIQGWYYRPVSGRRTKWTHISLTPPQETKLNSTIYWSLLLVTPVCGWWVASKRLYTWEYYRTYQYLTQKQKEDREIFHNGLSASKS